ncbi:16S rRNA (cytosine1402-N4)-methyltransferase [Elusimicrobium posterum]|uniref:16S rRNA (cytosine(1402)-N(4))-methyltransferase RsmH n=1 Tax=Elusimicrobium posterum TaxID=3116653 RepID=UPI003C755BE3
MSEWTHIPVLARECAENLLLKENGVYIDGTLGLGGHAAYFLKSLGPGAVILGFDKDAAAIEMAKKNVNDARLKAYNKSYEDAPAVLKELGLNGADGILLDLGLSSYQLDDGQRGFAFMQDGPLDMRFDQNAPLSAKEIVNNYPIEDLQKIFEEYGEEPRAHKAALAIVQARRIEPIETTAQLAKVLESALPRQGKMHGATRVFQGLRIAVNDELGTVERTVNLLPQILNPGGRAAVITFHSLEDRIVKLAFKSLAASGVIKLVNKHVIDPKWEEVKNNRRARSAKLRVVEKI